MVERIVPAIVFGGDINGLGIVRNLGREGRPVRCVLESDDRSWFQNSFPTRCGPNTILKAYLDAVGTTTPYGIRMICPFFTCHAREI